MVTILTAKQSLGDKVIHQPNKLSSMTQIKLLNPYITLLLSMNHLTPLSSSGWRRRFFFIIPRQIYHLQFCVCLILSQLIFGWGFVFPLFDLTFSFGRWIKLFFWAFVTVFFPSFSVLFLPDLDTFLLRSWGDWMPFCLVAPFPSSLTGFGAFPSFPSGFGALRLAVFTSFLHLGRRTLYLWLPLLSNHLGGWCC